MEHGDEIEKDWNEENLQRRNTFKEAKENALKNADDINGSNDGSDDEKSQNS